MKNVRLSVYVLGSMKVNNIYLESVLCKVDHSGLNNVLITNLLNNMRILLKGTYLADFHIAPKHISAILYMPDVTKYISPDSESHTQQ